MHKVLYYNHTTVKKGGSKMARTKAEPSQNTTRKIRPASTPEAREMQLVSLAVDLVEKQLLEGTASSQVITHYLKLGTAKEQLEREKLRRENAVLEAKANAYKSAENIEQLYKEAISAMKGYAGLSSVHDEDDD